MSTNARSSLVVVQVRVTRVRLAPTATAALSASARPKASLAMDSSAVTRTNACWRPTSATRMRAVAIARRATSARAKAASVPLPTRASTVMVASAATTSMNVPKVPTSATRPAPSASINLGHTVALACRYTWAMVSFARIARRQCRRSRQACHPRSRHPRSRRQAHHHPAHGPRLPSTRGLAEARRWSPSIRLETTRLASRCLPTQWAQYPTSAFRGRMAGGAGQMLRRSRAAESLGRCWAALASLARTPTLRGSFPIYQLTRGCASKPTGQCALTQGSNPSVCTCYVCTAAIAAADAAAAAGGGGGGVAAHGAPSLTRLLHLLSGSRLMHGAGATASSSKSLLTAARLTRVTRIRAMVPGGTAVAHDGVKATSNRILTPRASMWPRQRACASRPHLTTPAGPGASTESVLHSCCHTHRRPRRPPLQGSGI